MTEITLIVIAKEPRPGRCKTRLCPPLEHHEAAKLAEAALADTLVTVARAGGRRVLALDGRPGDWLPEGFAVIPQRGDGLDERLAAAFEDVGEPAFLVGMDTPQLGVEQIEAAVAALDGPGTDAVLGPAEDGGYWSIGLRRPDPAVFLGVPMSASATLASQRARLESLGLRHATIEAMRDFDTIEDAAAVAELCPDSRFAAQLARTRWPLAV